MKLIFAFSLILTFFIAAAQQKEFQLQGQVVDDRKNPVNDVYIFNTRTSVRSVSHGNGVFDVMVLPGDTILLSHVSYLRKETTVHQILINPVVQLDPDTVNIKQINVSASQRTSYEKAMENIKSINFDFRSTPDDQFTEQERMNQLLISEDEIQRVSASSLSLVRFSPSEQISKWKEKRKHKKEAKQIDSTNEVNENK